MSITIDEVFELDKIFPPEERASDKFTNEMYFAFRDGVLTPAYNELLEIQKGLGVNFLKSFLRFLSEEDSESEYITTVSTKEDLGGTEEDTKNEEITATSIRDIINESWSGLEGHLKANLGDNYSYKYILNLATCGSYEDPVTGVVNLVKYYNNSK